jgi:excinuclease ABC subunit C
MSIHDLKDQIARLPEQPGVYLYSNRAGETVYVGKARSLRDRVRTYLAAYGVSPRMDALLDEVARVDVIVTDSVVEALALENNLIKQRAPRYNILLRDDKNYPYLQLTTGEAFPRVLVARSVERDGHFYAGPFLPARLARRTMSLTHKLFGIRSCNEVITGRRGRPCLEYDIKRCLAPCVEAICSPDRYAQAVADTRLFLEGRNQELADELHGRMTEAAADERFEEAAALRDAMRTVQAIRDRQQKMATSGLGDRDVFGVATGAAGAVVHVFQVRGGRVVERVEFSTDTGGDAADEVAIIEAALQQFYSDYPAPPDIHVPVLPAEHEAIEQWLTARRERRVRVLVPQRGDKRGLLTLARRNAELAYRTRVEGRSPSGDEALGQIQAAFRLAERPRRIECFDISTIHGAETVASLVVCEDGRMKRDEYRKFRVGGPSTRSATSLRARPSTAAVADRGAERFLDDFAAMEQVVRRRYTRAMEQGGPFPDLIVIDGGKGQLNAAYAALETVGLSNLVAVGLAKQEELVFTRDSDQPMALDPHGPALRLLQRIRDEAHRFAVTFHRRARAMRDLRSELDAVPGVGARRRKALLTKFGSLSGVRRASREELTAVVGPRAAGAIIDHFARA